MDRVRDFVTDNMRGIIVAIIVAGAVTAIAIAGNSETNDNGDQASQETSSEVADNNGDVSEQSDEQTNEDNPATPEDGEVIGSKPQSGSVVVEKETDQFRTEVRQGDNQTVIVRQMVNEYLADESESLNVAQRLYMETVIVNSLPRDNTIFVGDVITVEKETIAKSASEAKSLTDAEQERWLQYL